MVEIITNRSGDWGICRVDKIIISQGHDVSWSPFLADLMSHLGIEVTRREISDSDMEDGSYG